MSNKYDINNLANWEEFKKTLLDSGYDEVLKDNFVKYNADGAPVKGVIKNTETYWRNIKWETSLYSDLFNSDISPSAAAVNRIEEEVNDVEFD